jgi:endonuclease/exonuclease/phosphatase family metal-dependent hydrolase
MPVFTLLSLNTFGIPFFLSLGRIKRLASELNRVAPTVVCLQEIQQNIYVPLLEKHLSEYAHLASFRHRYAPKGGLFTASIYSGDSEFHPFPNRGKPVSIGFADWALYKGVLVTTLEIQGNPVVVMNTHLQANYLGNWDISNEQTQIEVDQVKFLADLAQTQPADAWVFVCGDFNFPRVTPPYDLMMAESGLIDALVDDPRPTYRPFPLVSAKWQMSLDYFFYRRPEGDSTPVTADIVPIENSTAGWYFQRFLTDHHALVLNIG